MKEILQLQRLFGSGKTTNAIDWDNGFWLTNGLKTVGGALSGGAKMMGKFTNEERSEALKIMLDQSDDSKNSSIREAKKLAWLLLADYANGGKSVLSDIGVTHEHLISYLRDPSSPSVYKAMKYIGTEGFYGVQPIDQNGTVIENLPDTYLKRLKGEVGEGFHRQGLAKVPYDGYQAVLHAGETIMTASTTATMESMIQAFRESQNQNYRLDAAIQEQTAQLVSKIDEVINAIGSRSFGTTNTNTPSERLRESLRTLTSPLAFQG